MVRVISTACVAASREDWYDATVDGIAFASDEVTPEEREERWRYNQERNRQTRKAVTFGKKL